jgi:hypothetical protein
MEKKKERTRNKIMASNTKEDKIQEITGDLKSFVLDDERERTLLENNLEKQIVIECVESDRSRLQLEVNKLRFRNMELIAMIVSLSRMLQEG